MSGREEVAYEMLLNADWSGEQEAGSTPANIAESLRAFMKKVEENSIGLSPDPIASAIPAEMLRPGDLRDWQRYVWLVMDEKGFHEGRERNTRDDALVRLALVHTEVSELAQEFKRHGVDDPEAGERAEMEAADVFIRLADFCECHGLDLLDGVVAAMNKNRVKPRKYGTPDQEPTP